LWTYILPISKSIQSRNLNISKTLNNVDGIALTKLLIYTLDITITIAKQTKHCTRRKWKIISNWAIFICKMIFM